MALFKYLTKQKGIKIFAISMQNIEYQLNKDKQSLTNPVIKMPEYYHNFLVIFSKEASDSLSVHLKHDYVIKLLNEKILAKQLFVTCQGLI